MVMIVNGVFKGGGAKGVAYAGALQACEEAGVRFRAVAGSSAGAIAAALVACGYSARELADLLPTAMRCLSNIPAAALRFNRRCLFANRRLETWLDEAIARRVGARDHRPTFADVRNATGVELYVVAMDLGSRQPVVFSPTTSPQTVVSTAVVASSAIPVAFPASRMSDGDNVVRLIDGGVWANYPAFVFLDGDFRVGHNLPAAALDRPTMGFVLEDDSARDRVEPGALSPAHGPPLDADHGAAARELGLFGALVTSPVVRLSAIVAPIAAFLILLAWSFDQARSAFPELERLPIGVEDLAVIILFSLVVLTGLGAITSAVINLRFGRALGDNGLAGAVAAMGVGPSVPYWTGASSAAGANVNVSRRSHHVVRIPVDNSLSTLSFRADASEFFIVEYRTPSTPMHPDGGYDATVLGQGVAVWYVQREADGTAPTFDWPPPVVPVAGGDMWANFIVGPNGPGVGPFWTTSDGEFSLDWGDGTESALRLRVGPMSDSSPFAIVQWRHRDHPFLPRIDEVIPDEAGPGAHLVLDGVFGVRDDTARVVLEGDGGQHTLAIQSWSPTRVTARIGDDVDAGSYGIRAYSDATSSSGGNPVDFAVET